MAGHHTSRWDLHKLCANFQGPSGISEEAATNSCCLMTTNWRTFRKGSIWWKDPVTFHGTSHPMYAPRFLGVNSNVNRRKVHEQDDSQVDGNVSSGSLAFGFCTVWRCHEAGRQDETGRQHEERRHEEGQEVQEKGEEGRHKERRKHEARRQHKATSAPAWVLQFRDQGSWRGQYHRLP